MKKIIAFFESDETAQAVANSLNKDLIKDCEIDITTTPVSEAEISNYAYFSLALGATIGIIFGIAASYIEEIGFFGIISPVTGLVGGSVIGSILGCLLDILYIEDKHFFPKLTLKAPYHLLGSLSRILKKRGALSVFSVK